MIERKAIVLGATGLIGNELIHQLDSNKTYTEIHVLGRRDIPFKSSKIQFHQIDMGHIQNHADLFRVDDVFCCLGTTMKTAGSKEAFRAVDFQMVVEAASATELNAQQFIMISSLGAKSTSGNFYLRTKGEAEKEVLSKNITSIHILRPSILFGDRQEKRAGEKIGISVMRFLGPMMVGALKKYRGNEASIVASAMIQYALENKPGKFIHESSELDQIGHS